MFYAVHRTLFNLPRTRLFLQGHRVGRTAELATLFDATPNRCSASARPLYMNTISWTRIKPILQATLASLVAVGRTKEGVYGNQGTALEGIRLHVFLGWLRSCCLCATEA